MSKNDKLTRNKKNNNIIFIVLTVLLVLIIIFVLFFISKLIKNNNTIHQHDYLIANTVIDKQLEINNKNITGLWSCELSEKNNNADSTVIMCLDIQDDGILYSITAGSDYTKNKYELNNNLLTYSYINLNKNKAIVSANSAAIEIYIRNIYQSEDKVYMQIAYSDDIDAQVYTYKKNDNTENYFIPALSGNFIDLAYKVDEKNMGESLLLNIDSKKEECMIISSYGTKHYSIENKNNQIFLTNTEDESKYEIYIENNIVYLKNIENKMLYTFEQI